MDSGSIAVDATLPNEVSKFLEGLNFNLPELPQERTDPKPSKKLPASKVEVSSVVEPSSTSTSKIKKSVKERTRKDTSSKTPSKAPAIDVKSQTENKVVFNPASRFIVPPTSQWYNTVSRLNVTTAPPAVTPAQLNSLHTRAAKLHTEDMKTFTSSSSGGSSASEASFLSKIIQSGTLSDRLSALTLLVQSSPVHNLKALETLKGMSERGKGQGGREESLKALRCVVDWWVGGGAPEHKLKYFRDQPLLHPGVTDQNLVLWYFEDWLKKYFFSILQILENLSLDPLPYVRTQTLNLIFILLRDKPEQEQNLLRLLVNKLGDTEKSLCSRASYHILQLLQPHAPMKGVVVREITALVLRPAAPTAAATILAAAAFAATTSQLPANITRRKIRFAEDDTPTPTASSATSKSKGKVATAEKKQVNVHARYYATITFNQIVLTPADRDVALKLIDVYFEMFKELLGEGKFSEEGGVVEDVDDIAEVKTDKNGRVFDGKQNKGKGKGSIKEIKGAAGFGEIEDENSKLISAILTGVNRALPFAKIDAKDVGLLKHIDTLFLITHKSTFNISLQALLLIQHIAASLSSGPSSSASISKSIVDRYHRTLYASLHDERLASSSKQAMYLNLLFKSIKTDAGNLGNERIKALLRRFVQVLVSGGNGATEFIAGGLYLLGELFSTIPGLRSMVTEVAKQEEEPYDTRKRDPQHAHASSSPLWELTPLLHHYHPAISLHARQLLSSLPLTASADLSLNTLSHFLDRFVYKNAKKISPDATKGKGVSAMQPSASGIEGVKLIKGESATSGDILMNEEKFLKRRPEDVPVDQVGLSPRPCLFFHKYFTRKNERVREKRTKSSNEDSEVETDADSDGGEEMDLTGDEAETARGDEASNEEEEEGSELDEEEVWKAMQASMPKILADDDDLMNDSDGDPDGDDSSERSSLNDEDLQDEDAEEDSDNELSLVEGSDNEDLISLNDDGLIEYDGSDAEVGDAEEWDGIGVDSAKSNKRKRNDEEKKRRKKLRSLPTFASYEDYAKMIEDGPEDDI
ncbi:CBF/Mak21 family-domain-containing protein [Lentinula aff. lateritia]|uniref:CBF/Mak21 family-domain-containing protein n=1 Tax=Lentinula aff. lateritia TaxID=2804960 RepID=A0ACC1TRV7_9AGAR|nr:CBF/Mak21 family-domain-containing protein [Lentinula aff. lateritia]